MINTEQNETWRDVVGYEGMYLVSNLGRMKSLRKGFYGRIMHQTTNGKGYRRIGLSRDMKKIHYSSHRVVAFAFVSNHGDKPEVNHIDENKKNNRADNLEWCTRMENIHHGDWIEKKKKKVIQRTLEGEFIKEWGSGSDAGIGGYCFGSISKCCLGHNKTHRGYKWEFANGYS